MAQEMAPYGGLYITHLRSEADTFLEALDEAIRIGDQGGVPVEVYHLKAAGRRNWEKAARAIDRIDAARAGGQDVSANMYPYTAGSTGLVACMPPWASADGKLYENLADPEMRATIRDEILDQKTEWENFCALSGPDGVLILRFRNEDNQQYAGRYLSEISVGHGQGVGRRSHRSDRQRGRWRPEHDLFPDERGQRRAAARAALDKVRHRRRRRRPDGLRRPHPPTRLRHVSAHLGQVRSRTEGNAARRCHPQDDLGGGHAVVDSRPRTAAPRLFRRCRCLRPPPPSPTWRPTSGRTRYRPASIG